MNKFSLHVSALAGNVSWMAEGKSGRRLESQGLCVYGAQENCELPTQRRSVREGSNIQWTQ